MMKTIVIKLGGSSLQNPKTLRELAATVGGYRERGFRVVLVHGGGPAINEELTRRGITWTFVNGQRRTTSEMIEVIDQVLAHVVNGTVVRSLEETGIRAVGLSGADDGILFCSQMSEELGLVGQVDNVVTHSIEEVLAMPGSPTPVIAPIGGELGGGKYNVNADWAATKIAIALKAEKLIFLTDQHGILDEKRDLVRLATPVILRQMIDTGVISGGMLTKVLAMITALENKVKHVRVLHAGDASRILSRSKVGTHLTYEKTNNNKEVMHEHAS